MADDNPNNNKNPNIVASNAVNPYYYGDHQAMELYDRGIVLIPRRLYNDDNDADDNNQQIGPIRMMIGNGNNPVTKNMKKKKKKNSSGSSGISTSSSPSPASSSSSSSTSLSSSKTAMIYDRPIAIIHRKISPSPPIQVIYQTPIKSSTKSSSKSSSKSSLHSSSGGGIITLIHRNSDSITPKHSQQLLTDLNDPEPDRRLILLKQQQQQQQNKRLNDILMMKHSFPSLPPPPPPTQLPPPQPPRRILLPSDGINGINQENLFNRKKAAFVSALFDPKSKIIQQQQQKQLQLQDDNNNNRKEFNEKNYRNEFVKPREKFRKQFQKYLKELDENNLKKRKKRNFLLKLIVFFYGGFIANMLLWDPILKLILDNVFNISPNNPIMQNVWFEPKALDVWANFFIFSIVNPEEYLNGAKPQYLEHGPFIYKVSRKRRVIKWTNSTVLFKESFTAAYQDIPGSTSLDTRLTLINLPILVSTTWIDYIMEKYGLSIFKFVVHNIVTISLQTFGESLISKTTMREIMEGRPVKILHFLDAIVEPLRALHIPFPDYNKFITKFGEFRLLNYSFNILGFITGQELGPVEIYRFNEDGHKSHEIKSVLGKKILENYRNPCNRIKGVDLFHFGALKQPDVLPVYFQHFCRSISFVRNVSHFKRGINCVRYETPDTLFSSFPKENQCYCFNKRTLEQCDGYTDVSGCYGDIPIALSYPHFQGSKILRNQMRGMDEQHGKHISYMELVPELGIPFELSFKIQFNIMLRKYPQISQLSKIRPGLMPFFMVHVYGKLEGPLHWLLVIGVFILANGKWMINVGSILLGSLCVYKLFKI